MVPREKSTWAINVSANDRSLFCGHVGFFQIFFRSPLTLAFPSLIDQSETPLRSVSRSQRDASVGSMPKNCQKSERKIESVPLRPAASTVSFNGPSVD